MVSFIQGVTNGLRNAYCTQVANSPQWFSNIREILVPRDLKSAGDNLNRWVCDLPPDDTVFPPPPFTGGQCQTTYTLQIEGFDYNISCNEVPFTGQAQGAIGPIQGTRFIPRTSPLPNETCPDKGLFQYQNGLGEWITIAAGGQGGLAAATITSVTRADGLPDDCGDPDIELPPPGPITVNVDIDYGDDISITVPVIFAPIYVSVSGEIRIPVQIGEINLNGEITLSPEFNFEPNFGGEDVPPGVPDPDQPEPPPGTEDEAPEDDKKEPPIIGVFVFARVTGATRATSLAVPPAPPLTLPRLAQVIFRVGAAEFRGWTDPIDVKRTATFVYCPVPWGALGFRVSPTPGVEVEVQPIRARPIQEF